MRMTLVKLSGVSFKESSTSSGSSICIVGITIFLLFPKVRMTWIAPLSPTERRIGISHAIVPQSRGACTLGVVKARGRSPTPAPGGWPCTLPAARRTQAGGRSRAGLVWGDGSPTAASRSETLWHTWGETMGPYALSQRQRVAYECAVSRRPLGVGGHPLAHTTAWAAARRAVEATMAERERAAWPS